MQTASFELGEAQRHSLAVVGPGGVRILGSESVFDRDDRDAARDGQRLEPVVLQPAGAEDEAAAVDVQVDSRGSPAA